MMKLYNTLSGRIEDFYTKDPRQVKIYVCGPTVYNYIHIGNSRPMIVFDTLRRYFDYKGYNVNYVMNFTDIDDKILIKAKEENVDISVITDKYILETKKDMASLNILEPTHNPKATEEIPEIISMIDELVEKKVAYISENHVYFDVLKFNDYGKLSKKQLKELNAGSRIEVSDNKKSPYDFVLWKPSLKNEVGFNSPFGYGRPGWHIECSAMSRKYLGDSFDIHAGGEDLMFPHHENEIAQSESLTGVKMANFWLHNAFLNIDNEKMSKSLGNVLTVREACEKYTGNVVRFLILSTHYRKILNFTDEAVMYSKNSLEKIKNTYFKLNNYLQNSKNDSITSDETILITEFSKFRQLFEEAIEDDINTPNAITVLFELVKYINLKIDENSSKVIVEFVSNILSILLSILGLKFEEEVIELEEEIINLINERQIARNNKDYKKSDELRDILKEKGILVEDTRDGMKWKKI